MGSSVSDQRKRRCLGAACEDIQRLLQAHFADDDDDADDNDDEAGGSVSEATSQERPPDRPAK